MQTQPALVSRAAGAVALATVLFGAQPTEAQPTKPSATLQRAVEQYTNKAYHDASANLKKVVNGETVDSEANKQRAAFFFAKTLFQLEYHAAALASFDFIVSQGAAHRYHESAARWLVTLSRTLPDESGILEKLGSTDPSVFDAPVMEDVRGEALYLLGRHFYRRGEIARAISLLGRVDGKSPFSVKASFLVGVAHVRQLQAKPAAAAFQRVLDAAGQNLPGVSAKDRRRFENMANLALARLFFSVERHARALHYYNLVPLASKGYAAAQLESAWAHFKLGQESRAVARLQRSMAPAVSRFMPPEARTLEAFIYHRRCLQNAALRTVALFDETIGPLREGARALLDKVEDNAEFFELVMKLEKRGGLSPAEALLVEQLDAAAVAGTWRWVQELERELTLLEQAPRAWQTTQAASDILMEVTLQKALAEADAGKLLRTTYESVVREMRDSGRDSIKIKIEALDKKEGRNGAGLVPTTRQWSGAKAAPGAREDVAAFTPDEDDDEPPPDDDDITFDDEPEPEPEPANAERRMDSLDPLLKERVWEFVRAATSRGDAPVVLSGKHPMWKLNGGFGAGKKGDYRYRLRWTCPTPEPAEVTAADDGSPPTDLVPPDGDTIRPATIRHSVIRIRADLIREILVTERRLRASGLL